jgi:hypothetical protein
MELFPTNTQRIHSYAELQEQMHRDLLAQNPECITRRPGAEKRQPGDQF